jgi:tetratricopeptide (TPR) repeat protein
LCIRFLYEVADFDESLRIADIGASACEDKESLQYAHFCNTRGACYYDLNELKPCREGFETALAIREEKLPKDHKEFAISLANCGNLESAESQFDEALDLFQRAATIRERLGDESAVRLAVNYLCIGRVYHLTSKPDDALMMFQRAESLYIRIDPRNKHYLAQ